MYVFSPSLICGFYTRTCLQGVFFPPAPPPTGSFLHLGFFTQWTFFFSLTYMRFFYTIIFLQSAFFPAPPPTDRFFTECVFPPAPPPTNISLHLGFLRSTSIRGGGRDWESKNLICRAGGGGRCYRGGGGNIHSIWKDNLLHSSTIPVPSVDNGLSS
jgi:hypothetical protein